MPKIENTGQLAELLEAIREGRCHFLGYQQPLAMIAEDNVVHDVPIGHLIPGLMRIASGGPALPEPAAPNPETTEPETTEAAEPEPAGENQ